LSLHSMFMLRVRVAVLSLCSMLMLMVRVAVTLAVVLSDLLLACLPGNQS
jgi:hypothetical protein